MSAHHTSPTSEERGGAPLAAAGRAEDDAPEQPPTMNQLLAACAAASAVSTPPRAPAAARVGKPAGPIDENTEDAAGTEDPENIESADRTAAGSGAGARTGRPPAAAQGCDAA
ncbi:hypothetical protein [Streptomyces celluloflavus]|uniref:hypothetical protein n=1 Tax=Streptomyces celluloflavus TaxID=58344 RepID=UPI0036ACD49B